MMFSLIFLKLVYVLDYNLRQDLLGLSPMNQATWYLAHDETPRVAPKRGINQNGTPKTHLVKCGSAKGTHGQGCYLKNPLPQGFCGF